MTSEDQPRDDESVTGGALDPVAIEPLIDQAMRRYFRARHEKVDGFVDRHFSLSGSLRLHRNALGWDMVRAPANAIAIGPILAARLAGHGARTLLRRAGSAGLAAPGWLSHVERLQGVLATDVSRELEWALHVELLEVPYARGGRVSRRDALAETIFMDPRISAAIGKSMARIGRHADDREFRSRLEAMLESYAGSRIAAADIATSLLSLAVGAASVRQFTPGLVSLGPSVAAAIAQHVAIINFPLGATLGAMWNAMFPVSAGAALQIGATGGMLVAAGALSAFAGVVADPVQRAVGLHQRRLHKLIDAIEVDLVDGRPNGLVLREQYLARVLDVLDLLRSAARLAR